MSLAKVILYNIKDTDSEIAEYFDSNLFSIHGNIDLESGYRIVFDQIMDQISNQNIRNYFYQRNKTITGNTYLYITMDGGKPC